MPEDPTVCHRGDFTRVHDSPYVESTSSWECAEATPVAWWRGFICPGRLRTPYISPWIGQSNALSGRCDLSSLMRKPQTLLLLPKSLAYRDELGRQ